MYALIISRGYPTNKYKMNGIFEFDQAKALAKSGCKVVLAAIDVRSIKRWRKWGFETLSRDGVHVYAVNIPLGRIPKSLLTIFLDVGLKMLYNRIVKEQGKPDVIHAHFTWVGYIASKLKDKTNIPLVITEHSSEINKDKIDQSLYNKAKMAYLNADALISVSPALANIIESKFKIKPIYIPNIVDTSIFKYAPKSNNDIFSFVSTGNLIDTKRMDLTIIAFSRAFYNNSGVSLTIFGDGPERKRIEEIIARYSLNDKVILRGMCSRNEIADQFSKSKCFVLASQSETFGVAYIEALSMGLPVIATRCGGPEGFVHEKNGIIIPVDNVEELANAMEYMYEHINAFDNEKISIETKEWFSPDKVAEKIIEVYRSLVTVTNGNTIDILKLEETI